MAITFDRSLIGSEFDRTEGSPVTREEILEYSAASGEPYSTSGDTLVASPTFVVRMRGRHFMPRNLPTDWKSAFDAGKDLELGVPIHEGDVLTGVSTLHDMYEKTGRSGSMGFLVLRTVLTNQRGEQVAVIDQKMMFR